MMDRRGFLGSVLGVYLATKANWFAENGLLIKQKIDINPWNILKDCSPDDVRMELLVQSLPETLTLWDLALNPTFDPFTPKYWIKSPIIDDIDKSNSMISTIAKPIEIIKPIRVLECRLVTIDGQEIKSDPFHRPEYCLIGDTLKVTHTTSEL